jgi:hypothetical protein
MESPKIRTVGKTIYVRIPKYGFSPDEVISMRKSRIPLAIEATAIAAPTKLT